MEISLLGLRLELNRVTAVLPPSQREFATLTVRRLFHAQGKPSPDEQKELPLSWHAASAEREATTPLVIEEVERGIYGNDSPKLSLHSVCMICRHPKYEATQVSPVHWRQEHTGCMQKRLNGYNGCSKSTKAGLVINSTSGKVSRFESEIVL